MDLFIIEASVRRLDVAEQLRECLTDAKVTNTAFRRWGENDLWEVSGRIVNQALLEKALQIVAFEQPSIFSFNIARR